MVYKHEWEVAYFNSDKAKGKKRKKVVLEEEAQPKEAPSEKSLIQGEEA